MTVVLVTGAAGLVGTHLCRRLEAGGAEVMAVDRRAVPGVTVLDVGDPEAMRALVATRRPAAVHHLAAQSSPVASRADPGETMRSNVLGTVNLFEAVRAAREEAPWYDPMIVVACSSAEYGAALTPERLPVGEDAPLLPLHPYGVSKVAQDLLAFQYWRAERIRCVRARIFNSTGPGKTDDVVSDFCRRAVAIARQGTGGDLRVGNLDSRRAILDVRDLVEALLLLASRGAPGEAYNVCAAEAVRIGDIIPMLERLGGVTLRPLVDPALLRPVDEPVIVGCTERLRHATGWRPHYTFAQTVRAVFEHERGA